MPKHPIRITEAAERDLADIVDYITNNNPAAALKLADKIEQSILQLENFPNMGVTPKNRSLMRKGYRMLIVDSYLVFYVLMDDETVEVRRIISGKREYKFLL